MAPPSKKTKLSSSQPAEILFDPNARQDYLTGFHKRKVARIEHAKEAAVKRAREERVLERRQLREQRKEDLKRHVLEVDRELRKMNPELSDGTSDEEEDVEITDTLPTAEQLEREEDFVDEDKYTTVTVEAMGEEHNEFDEPDMSIARPTLKDAGGAAKNKNAPSKKKKKFRYETKSERQETRRKQKAKNSRAAKARKESK